MASRNDITGDSLVSKSQSVAYRDGWDRIFKKKHMTHEVVVQQGTDDETGEEFLFITLPDEIVRELGLSAGDTMKWNVDGDVVTLTKA